MVPLDRALVSSYRLSIVAMSLSAAVWPQFATQVFRGGIGRLATIQNVTDRRQTDDRRAEHRTISATVLPSTVG